MRTVTQIDKDITANHRHLRRLERIKPMSAASWQAAWDKHPDLWERERALYLERGLAQKARDETAAKVTRRRASRPIKYKQCPTCGCHTLAKAA
jgi:hypothetical protein